MNYVDYSHRLYKLLEKTDYDNIEVDFSGGLNTFISSITKNISWEELKKLYRKEIQEVIDDKLSFFKDDIEIYRRIKDISYYEDSISAFTSTFLFWIWNNGIDFPRNSMNKIVRAVFAGTIGYKLLDVHTDTNFLGKEAIFLGMYMIRDAEESFLDDFDAKETIKIFNDYVRRYTQIEYLEKRHLWKACPFEWEDAHQLGDKAAPMYSIFELILRVAKMEEQKINDLVEGLKLASAGIQMMDDLTDSYEDLSNGIESLAMSGFYDHYGTDVSITRELIEEFLTKERFLKIYYTTRDLFNEAREIFTKYDDDMLLLFLEIQSFKLNLTFETTDEDE